MTIYDIQDLLGLFCETFVNPASLEKLISFVKQQFTEQISQ